MPWSDGCGMLGGGSACPGAPSAQSPPLHVPAPVPHRLLPQFPLWGCQGWQEEPGELDEPSQDLTTGAGSIPPVLQARAGHEVQPHVCQGTLGTCHCQPTMGENAPKLSGGGSGPLILPPPASQHCRCPYDPKSTPNPFGHGMSIALSPGSGRCSTYRVVVPRSPPGPTVPPWMQAPGQASDGRARPGCCGDVPAPLLTSDGGKSRPQSK